MPFVSDFFDFSVYIDADEAHIRRWYIDRFLRLKDTAFRDPHSYFNNLANVSDAEAGRIADDLWTGINLVNLRENILPTRPRAALILRKDAAHRIEQVALRRL
jgi:type I pantothenate kinase